MKLNMKVQKVLLAVLGISIFGSNFAAHAALTLEQRSAVLELAYESVQSDMNKINALESAYSKAKFENGVYKLLLFPITPLGLAVIGTHSIPKNSSMKKTLVIGGVVLLTGTVIELGNIFQVNLTDLEMKKLRSDIEIVSSDLKNRTRVLKEAAQDLARDVNLK